MKNDRETKKTVDPLQGIQAVFYTCYMYIQHSITVDFHKHKSICLLQYTKLVVWLECQAKGRLNKAVYFSTRDNRDR